MENIELKFDSYLKIVGFRKNYKRCRISYQKRSELFLVKEEYYQVEDYFDNILKAINKIEEINKLPRGYYEPKARNTKTPKWVIDAKEYFASKY